MYDNKSKPELREVKDLHCSECGEHPRGVSGIHFGNKCPRDGGYYHDHFAGAVGCGPNCPRNKAVTNLDRAIEEGKRIHDSKVADIKATSIIHTLIPKDPACEVHRMDTEFAICPTNKDWHTHVRGKCGCKCTCKKESVRHMLIGGSESPKFIALVDAIIDWAFDNGQILERVSDSSLPWLVKRIENVARWYRKSPAESD